MIYITCIAVCFMLILFCAIVTLKCTKCERLFQAPISSNFFILTKIQFLLLLNVSYFLNLFLKHNIYYYIFFTYFNNNVNKLKL